MDTDLMTSEQGPLAAPLPATLAAIPETARGLVFGMFVDPHALEKNDRTELLARLRDGIAAHPEIAELRVVFGMALCVDLEVQEAIEQLQHAVRLDPDSFIAHLKMGELWMRLRVCRKAEEHTRRAAALARNLAQAELSRRQGAAIRTLLRDGVERGGHGAVSGLRGLLRRLWSRGGALSPAEDPGR